jgi:hypothetical protein
MGQPGEHLIKFFEDVRRGDEIVLGSYTFCPESVGAFESVVVARGKDGASGTPRHGSHGRQTRVGRFILSAVSAGAAGSRRETAITNHL